MAKRGRPRKFAKAHSVIPFRMDPRTREELEALAKSWDCSMSDVVRRAITMIAGKVGFRDHTEDHDIVLRGEGGTTIFEVKSGQKAALRQEAAHAAYLRGIGFDPQALEACLVVLPGATLEEVAPLVGQQVLAWSPKGPLHGKFALRGVKPSIGGTPVKGKLAVLGIKR